MLNVKDIWIGEKLRIISSGRTGIFRGIHKNGKGRIECDGKIFLASGKNLKIYNPKEKVAELDFSEDQPQKKSVFDFSKTIDLHIEKLKPDLVTALPERIIDYQIKAFENYLEEALELGINEIIVIHGKGTGVLKNSIIALIKTDKRVRLYTEINQGGALELLL